MIMKWSNIIVKDVELNLLSELMKNSRRSDRELAKAIGSTQPTVTRTRRKLEKLGVIREYTAIPDFSKLGYELLSLTFVKMKVNLSSEQENEVQKFLSRFMEEYPHAELISAWGIGLNKDFVFVTFFKDFSDYWNIQRTAREVPYSDINTFESFLVDLKGSNIMMPLTLSSIAKDILISEKKKH
jgi:DNA-binding Lrp family transcriptional regulator